MMEHVAVIIAVLAVVFMLAFIGLVLVIKQKCKKTDLISQQHKDVRPDAQLIVESSDLVGFQSPLDVELSDVKLTNPRLEHLLNNEQWVDDAMGLVPHCLTILRTCHSLTEQLVKMTSQQSHLTRPEYLANIVVAAKRINPRVDDTIQSIYPPLDPRLLEARFTALVLSVSHLVMITKNACKMSGAVDWIDQSLQEVERHLKILREASALVENHRDKEPGPESQISHPGTKPLTPLPRNDISQF